MKNGDFFSFSSLFSNFELHIQFQGLKTMYSNDIKYFQVFSAVNMKFWLLSYPKMAKNGYFSMYGGEGVRGEGRGGGQNFCLRFFPYFFNENYWIF